jgi:hypothetical protein
MQFVSHVEAREQAAVEVSLISSSLDEALARIFEGNFDSDFSAYVGLSTVLGLALE